MNLPLKGNPSKPSASVSSQPVSHNYIDYSDEEDRESQLSILKIRCNSVNSNKGGDHSFPVKLHYMLDEVEKDGLAHIISWQPHGRCFVVRDQEAFVKSVLPNWFRQTKFTSFQRQLNLYGFRRLTHGIDKGGYYHELCLRGKPLLPERIMRVKVKGMGPRKKYCPDSEPNFYAMKFLPITLRKPKLDGILSNNVEPTVSDIYRLSSASALQLPNTNTNSGCIGYSPTTTMYQNMQFSTKVEPPKKNMSMGGGNTHQQILNCPLAMQLTYTLKMNGL